jgi:hypothetical protein
MATVMLCLALKNGEPCITQLDGLRTTCRAKRCIALKTLKPSYIAHHEVYRDLIKEKFWIEADVHRNRCLDIYRSDARIAYLGRIRTNMHAIYLEQREQQDRERKAEEDLEQTRLLLGTLDDSTMDYANGPQLDEEYPEDDLLKEDEPTQTVSQIVAMMEKQTL